jgi:hypothetical protein
MPLVEAQLDLNPRSLNLLHRLDRSTSGLILAAPSSSSSSHSHRVADFLLKLFQKSTSWKQQQHAFNGGATSVGGGGGDGGENGGGVIILKTYVAKVEGKFPALDVNNDNECADSCFPNCKSDQIFIEVIRSRSDKGDDGGSGGVVFKVNGNIGMKSQQDQMRGVSEDGKESCSLFTLISKLMLSLFLFSFFRSFLKICRI